MAAMSAADIAKVSRLFAENCFVQASATATLSHADIVAAVTALDNAMEGLPSALPNQAQSVALNFNAALPNPFKTTATTGQKSILMALWVSVKYGYL